MTSSDRADAERLQREDERPPHLHTIELGKFLAGKFPEPPPLLGRALREGSLAMVHGRAGAGKTFLMLGMGIAAAYGVEFLGWGAPQPVPVLYVDGEMAAYDLQARLKALSHWVLETIDHPWQPMYLVTPGLQPDGIRKIDTPEGRAALIDAVMRNSVRLVFLDNLSCLTNPEDDNASSSWSAVQELVHHLRLVGVAVVIGHHSGKNGEQRGTSRRADLLDLVLKLTSAADGQADGRTRITVEFEKARHLRADEAQSFVAVLEPHPKGGLVWSRGESAPPVGDRAREMLATGMSAAEVATELHAGRSYVYRIREEMLRTGELDPPQSTRRVSPVPSLRRGTGDDNLRPRGRDRGQIGDARGQSPRLPHADD